MIPGLDINYLNNNNNVYWDYTDKESALKFML